MGCLGQSTLCIDKEQPLEDSLCSNICFTTRSEAVKLRLSEITRTSGLEKLSASWVITITRVNLMESRWVVNGVFPVTRRPEKHSSVKFLIKFLSQRNVVL